MGAAANKIALSYNTDLPRAHPDIVHEEAYYRCPASGAKGSKRWFYEIVLATKRLDFRQRARIYWLLRDVNFFSARNKLKSRIVLIIGDLETTHFRESEKEGEVASSVTKLEKWFQPAIQSKMLSIRVHKFKQSDLDNLSKKVAGRAVEG